MPGNVRFGFGVVDHSLVNLRKMGEYINAGMETVVDIAEDVVQNEKDNESVKSEELKTIMRDYCKMEQELEQFLKAVEDVKAHARAMDDDEIPDLEKILDEKLAATKPNEKVEGHAKFVELLEKMNSADGADESIETAATEEEKGDSDVEVTQQEINTKCPFTGLEMQHPVKNKHCGHTYDRDGISQFIKSRGKRAKCPVAGCANQVPLAKNDLSENKEVKKFMDKKNKAAKRLGRR